MTIYNYYNIYYSYIRIICYVALYYSEKELGTAFNGTHDTKTVVEQIQQVSNNPQPLFEHLEERSPYTFDAIISILHYAASCEMLEDTIDSLSDTHPTILRLTPHLSCHMNKVIQHRSADDVAVHQSRLSNVL